MGKKNHNDNVFIDDENPVDDYGVPTYDEIDIQGRYYTYGSRSEYNEWRRNKIEEIKEERREKERMRRLKASNIPNEYNDVEIPKYDDLNAKERMLYSSREDYDSRRNDIIRKRKFIRHADTFRRLITLSVKLILAFIFIYIVYLLFTL